MRLIITILLAGLLAACGSTTKLNFGDKENPSRVTSVEGLESHDAANVMTNKDYIDGKTKAPQKALVSFKAHPGQQITINAAEFTVWQPTSPADDIRPAPQAKSTFERNTAAVGGLLKDATPIVLGGMALSDRKGAREAATEQANIAAETERARDQAQADQNASLIQGLKEKPQVIFAAPLPAAGSTSTESTTAAPAVTP